MTTLDEALADIVRRRRRDPLAPVTVVAPSHLAALQLRRRLAEQGPFAGVRFETLPRLAELLGASVLAQAGRSPLARPIGDYVATRVALETGSTLVRSRELPGYARVLRQTFRRLRRAGFRDAGVPVEIGMEPLGEIVRLFGLFRQRTSAFYDEEDLLEAGAEALAAGTPGFASELGRVYVVPPGALSAGADRLVQAMRRRTTVLQIDDDQADAQQSFVLAPDPATEAREVVREVLGALEAGLGLHEVAVLHGSDSSYGALLTQAFEAADVPSALMPGRPLIETPAGRATLALAELPLTDFGRAPMLDFLNLAPLRPDVPAGSLRTGVLAAAWQRLAREAGVTHGNERWQSGLEVLSRERRSALESREELSENRRALYELDIERADGLRSVIGSLIGRLENLRRPREAKEFVGRFKGIVTDYLRRDSEGLDAVIGEIDQLGTIDAVGGSFTLASFSEALRANLSTKSLRQRGLGDGVLVADFKLAAGLRFRHVVLCGAYEGVFPTGAGSDTLVADEVWARLRRTHPFVEDAGLRMSRSREAARRAIAAAGEHVTWTAPLRESSGARDLYPASLMLQSAREIYPEIETATMLRGASARPKLRRPASPLAARLMGEVLDTAELRLRGTVDARQQGIVLGPNHRLRAASRLLAARRSNRFSEFDGNISSLEGRDDLLPQSAYAPTSLEAYATCGFRFYLSSVLRLRPVQEPEERDTIDPAERGSLIHAALQRFYQAQLSSGRPEVNEAWSEDDVETLLDLADEELQKARERGAAGLDVYAAFDRRTMRADLAAFLEKDTEFRLETGARPFAFELGIPPTTVAGVGLKGFVDRIDMTPDRSHAWVLDYKTGSARSYEHTGDGSDPFAGGTKLQLPVYVYAVAGVESVTAAYWFITRRGEFRRIAYESNATNQERFEATLRTITHGMQSGAFPAVPGEDNDFYGNHVNCTYCDFDRICTRRRAVDFLRKGEDELMLAWLSIAPAARGDLQT